jgi:TP901 family phage tail tape measure protein
VGVINAVTDAFKGLVMETIQFEKTLSEINVVMNSSASALRNFGDELFNVSRNTAQGFNVVAEAALEFSRQGLTMEETLRRTNDALILTRLTSLKATEAVSGLTAAVNAFGSAGLTTTEIIDKLAAVDVNFAVSSEDLIHALERTGAVAISAGVELDNLIGLVTALQQSTARGGSVIGNGLKTIFTRIQRPASLRQLEEMNIAVRDLTGAVLPADKILQNIAKTFDTLSQAQQSNLVQFSAGIFQANIFRAALADLSKEQNIFADASKISADAAGNAAVKNAALNKTLAAMVSQTSSSVKELAGALGEIMLEDDLKSWTKGFKSLVDSLTGALDGG